MLNNRFEEPKHRKKIQRTLPDSVEIPGRITNSFLAELLYQDFLVLGGYDSKDLSSLVNSYSDDTSRLIRIISERLVPEESKLVEDIEKLKPNQMIQIPPQYRIPKAELNQIIKGIDTDFIKLHSTKIVREVLRDYANQGNVVALGRLMNKNFRLSDSVIETLKIWPYTLLKKGIEMLENGVAPIGYAWYGNDKRMRAVLWDRLISGMRKYIAYKKGLYNIELLGEKVYGKNAGARVESLSKEIKEAHEFPLTHLPIFYKDDPRQYSFGFKLVGQDVCRDKQFTSFLHDKFNWDPIIFCSHEIAAFFKSMEVVSKEGADYQFRINPFAIALERTVGFVDKLLDQGYIIDKDGKKRDLNDVEISRLVGMYIKEYKKEYDDLFYHWGKPVNPEEYVLKGLPNKNK